ncbi:histidine phosphatase family protein [Pseudomonas koreensis]|uniref:Histidine phosphatase n=1 Tax=Pseudomonas koreensis TaxID=198620 RepID=A0AA94JJX0_9PSED|nr:histidine phosphatase family protein [Pseudomonas koreensis]RVD79772.1 Histidine phosphatase [Pseudomonas koreensis]
MTRGNVVVELVQIQSAPKRSNLSRPRTWAIIAVGLLLIALILGFVWMQRSPANLRYASASATQEWVNAWQAGEVVALVRHTERCDRSTNTCLGPADGITQVGSVAAGVVGRGFTQLGLEKTQFFSSPLTRTMQTAHYMLGHDAVAQEWLETCGPTLRDDVVAHKTPGQNMILVTHSGCIADFERQTGYPRAVAAEYGSAVLMRIDAQGQLKVIGIMNPEGWQRMSK